MVLLTQIPNNIMLIDENNSLVDFLSPNLKGEGYCVSSTSQSRPFKPEEFADINIVIIDAPASTTQLAELIAKIKTLPQGNSIGIICCSDFDDEHSLIAALDAGADDCVRRPFSLRELLARIRAIIRRRTAARRAEDHILIFKGLSLNLELKTASIDGTPLPLSNTEFALLALLMRRIGSFISRDKILSAIWAESSSKNPRIVDTNISRLRQKLGPLAQHLINRPNKGYTLTD